ncbi:MAG: FAS1 domain-containing protein [Monoraphidium minutum]|nr:MAG: FAS1 domain-containing protein [Monoraphidium minutum]
MMRSLLLLALLGLASAQLDVKQLSTCKSVIKLLPELKTANAGYTIFCPTNEAFNNMADELNFADSGKLLAKISSDPALRAIVGFHVVKGVSPAASLKDGASLQTLAGAPLKVVKEDGDIAINSLWVDFEDKDGDDSDNEDAVEIPNATFEGPFKAGSSKYVVHVIDRVLTPPAAASALRKVYSANNA